MTKYIIMRTITDTDYLKYPGSKIIAYEDGWYILKIPVLEDTSYKNRFLNINDN